MGTAASAAGVEYFLNRSCVTMFTRSSVHCAERIVAISSSNGVSCTRAQVASGYSRLSRLTTSRACFLLLAGAASIVLADRVEKVGSRIVPRQFAGCQVAG